MSRLFIVILVIGFILISCSGEAAMKEMTTESLKQVEGGSDASSYQNIYSSIDAVDVSPKKSELSTFEDKFTSLKQSRNYVKFFLLLNKLEKISKRNNYEKILDTKSFLDLCLNISSFSEHCRKNLTLLAATVENGKIQKLLNTQRKIFVKVNHFYDRLSDYQSGKGASPDLKELIAEIRLRQDNFETEYNKLKGSKY